MHTSMHRRQAGDMIYYTCELISVPHAFTTRHGGVSRGDCAGMNLGFGRGDSEENVHENYRILTQALGVPYASVTMTKQVHEDEVSCVGREDVGMGLHKPFVWESDAIITGLLGVPLAGFYADCVVTLLYDPKTHTAGVCHSGWRGTAKGILGKTIDSMAQQLGSQREHMIAVIGPSICQACFETDADVPDAMHEALGDMVLPYVKRRQDKFHVDLQGINAAQLRQAGLREAHIIDSGICTMCERDVFWSHRATSGRRGVQAGIICLTAGEEARRCE